MIHLSDNPEQVATCLELKCKSNCTEPVFVKLIHNWTYSKFIFHYNVISILYLVQLR